MTGTIPIKTAQGQAELSTRERRVSQRHRTVLFLIDGKRDAAEVRDLAARAGAPGSCFGELLELGLIELRAPVARPSGPAPSRPMPLDTQHVELPLEADESPVPGTDSVLPASRTLYPSISSDSTLTRPPLPDSWLPSDLAEGDALDLAFVEARLILLRAVRAEAPLSGSLTMLRLRRARRRVELGDLLDEVEARITRPHRSLAAAQTMRRVRQLLAGELEPGIAAA
jgi:hypothetical protein